MDSKKLAVLCRTLAENRKAEDITILEVNEFSSITDYFVIMTGTSDPHLRAILSEITDTLKTDHKLTPRSEGGPNSSWVVLDYFDVIVHIMRKDVRELYKLEDLWGDAPRLGEEKASTKKATAAKVKRASTPRKTTSTVKRKSKTKE
jgi:ribosome-associated protein